MAAQQFTVRPKLDRDRFPTVAMTVFVMPWALVAWYTFLCEALGFDLPAGTNKWMAIPIAAIFLPIQWAAARALLDRRDRLVADASGIMWRPWSEDVIPWEEIRAVRPVTVFGRRFVSLDLHHPERYPATTGLKWTAWANRKAGYGDVSIQTDGTDTDQAELAQVIAQFREAAAGPGGMG
jgi:hypothetical protein